jgi:hypothetical protein
MCINPWTTRLNPLQYLSGHKSKSRHVLMISYSTRVFALIINAQINFSFSPSPCSLT